jgi:putative two-component system response regulator
MTETTLRTILAVDDSPENLNLLGELLQPYYRVRVATSGNKALRLANSEPYPDLVLLDVMMPEIDGYQVFESLRANPETRHIPVIFVTAMSNPESELQGLSVGAVDYIAKPINPGILLARINTQLELKDARDKLTNQNAWLEAEVARRSAENELIQEVSIRALAHLAETRDPETGNHILRTQNYVRLLATLLLEHPRFTDTLNSHYIEMLSRSAPLHDIGKVGIPDSILRKPGKLTEDEWDVMKTHAYLGAVAIEEAERDVEEQVLFLSLAKEIAHRHHEKWDGSGYPDGLAGEGIPISARIMALADVFDALLSRRVYKKPLPVNEVLDIIAEGHGKHFDPDIVDVFLGNIDAFLEIANRYSDSPQQQPLENPVN